MTPLFPPPSFVFDPITMLAWGGLAAAVPFMVFLFMAMTQRKLGMVVSLVVMALTFALGAVFIAPADAQRLADEERQSVVAPWLDKYYPQYGGAALYKYVGSGKSFQATGPNGREYTMYFATDKERGVYLVSAESRYSDGVPPVGNVRSLAELVKAQAEAEAQAEEEED